MSADKYIYLREKYIHLKTNATHFLDFKKKMSCESFLFSMLKFLKKCKIIMSKKMKNVELYLKNEKKNL